MRYVIKDDISGNIVESTLPKPIDSNLNVYGSDLQNPNEYRFNYYGNNAKCGQEGVIVTSKIDANSLELVLLPDHILLIKEQCPDGYAEQIIPTKSIILSKE